MENYKIFITRKGNMDYLNIESAIIIHRNFSGRETKYNREGNRNFSVVLREEDALQLQERGWNVKSRPSRDDQDSFYYFMPVSVNFNSKFPPKVYRITDSGVDDSKAKKVSLTDKTVGVLDISDIINADLVINGRPWETSGASGVKAYLNAAYIEVEEDAFASKYADYEEG